VLMHTCINTGMIAMVKTLNLFTRERAIVGRERTKNAYDTSAYVLSKVRRYAKSSLLFCGKNGTQSRPVGVPRCLASCPSTPSSPSPSAACSTLWPASRHVLSPHPSSRLTQLT
jgi:hypothetical protein